jgi:tRNA threonylcarbamoyladenosine biosynthesis protein TsaB
MSYLLHLETATTNCSVALSQNGNLLHCIENNAADFRHSDHLHLFIEQLLKKAQIEAKQLSGVAVSMGPGSYTGLRIGVSSAKGLCYANDIPLIAVNSLEVLAAAYNVQADDILIPMFDARRMEVYALGLNAQKEVIQPTQAVIITPDSFQEFQNQGRLVFFGNGADVDKDRLAAVPRISVDGDRERLRKHIFRRTITYLRTETLRDAQYRHMTHRLLLKFGMELLIRIKLF